MMTRLRVFIRKAMLIGMAFAVVGFLAVGIYQSLTDPTRQDYLLEQLDYQVVIQEDGSSAVTETRTFAFNRGSYTFAWFELAIEAKDISVWENGRPYTRLAGTDSNRPEQHYTVVDQGSQYRVEWYYRAQAPQIRHFEIRYTIPDAAIAYQDCVVYFQKYLSEANTTPIGLLTASVQLPPGANAENTLIWGHGPGYGQIFFHPDRPNQVDLSVEKPGLNQYVEARFLMPRASLSRPNTVIERAVYDEVYAEEMEAAAAARRQLILARVLFGLAILAVLALAVITVWLRYKHQSVFNRYEPALSPPYYRDIPAQVPPAIVARLHRYYGKKEKTSDLISLTILDLIYRRVLFATPHPDGRKMETWLQLAQTEDGKLDILEYERPVIDFLFRDVAGGQQSVSMSQLTRYCKRQRNHGIIEAMIKSFEAHTNRIWAAYQYVETKKNQLPASVIVTRILALGLSVLGFLFIFGFVSFPLGASGLVLAVGGGAAFLINLILCHKRKMLTQKGEDELALWQALERFFKEFSAFDEKELPEIGFWEKLLVYAAALDVADRVMQQLQVRYPQLRDQQFLYSHYYFMYSFSRMGPDVGSGFSTFRNSLNTAMRDAQTVVSRHHASRGGGGGFSGGGSSGGGGAGGSTGGGAG